MSRKINEADVRCMKTTRTLYTLEEGGEFTAFEDDQFYKQKTLAESMQLERTRRYASRFNSKKSKRNRQETKSKGRCNNKNYKLSEKRFNRGGKRNGATR